VMTTKNQVNQFCDHRTSFHNRRILPGTFLSAAPGRAVALYTQYLRFIGKANGFVLLCSSRGPGFLRLSPIVASEWQIIAQLVRKVVSCRSRRRILSPTRKDLKPCGWSRAHSEFCPEEE
jgi:hypothetical protein